jgi:hypothetical protein
VGRGPAALERAPVREPVTFGRVLVDEARRPAAGAGGAGRAPTLGPVRGFAPAARGPEIGPSAPFIAPHPRGRCRYGRRFVGRAWMFAPFLDASPRPRARAGGGDLASGASAPEPCPEDGSRTGGR